MSTKRTSSIVRKFIDKQLHTPNMLIGAVFVKSDIPFKRPQKYYFRLANDDKIEVSKYEYEKYKVGDDYSYVDPGMDPQIQILVTSVIVALIVVLMGIFFCSRMWVV